MVAFDIFALAMLAICPAFPLYWLALHGLRRFWKRLGGPARIPLWALLALLVGAGLWLVFAHRGAVTTLRINTGLVGLAGWPLIAIWLFFEYWTKQQLGVVRLIGLAELLSPGLFEGPPQGSAALVTTGPYSLLRHPRYASFWLLFLGLFLLTGLLALLALCLYWAASFAFVIPLEDRELVERYGEAYLSYQRRVPALFPRLRRIG